MRTPAEDTKALVESMRSRFRAEASRALNGSERLEDLDRELREYFARHQAIRRESSATAATAKLQDRVIDAVADRILEQWDACEDSVLQDAVMERLISRILERLRSAA